MLPAKDSHHSPNSTHNEENKTINLSMLLSALSEKKRLTTQSIQNSTNWCPISITKQTCML